MAFFDFFRSRDDDADFEAQVHSLDLIQDEKALLRVAKKTRDPLLQREAIRRLKNQTALATLAKGNGNGSSVGASLRETALENLVDPSALSDVAFNAHSGEIRVKALEKMWNIAPDRAREVEGEMTICLYGHWLKTLWKDRPVSLPVRVDVHRFFGQHPLPPLWPDDRRYARRYKGDKDRALHWMATLLSHPSEKVALDVLRYWEARWAEHADSEVERSTCNVLLERASFHLLSDNPELVGFCARFIWRAYSQEHFETLFSYLAGPAYPDEHKAVDRLAQYCPTQFRAAFGDMRERHFAMPA